MTAPAKGPPLGAYSVEDLLGWLARLRGVLEPLAAAGARPLSARTELADFALGALGVSRELASGIQAEGEAGRAGDVMRLARHLFEQELDLEYVVADPAPRIRQMRAREASLRLALAKHNPRMFKLGQTFRKRLKELTRDAQTREEALGKDPEDSDRGYPPRRLGIAQAIGREDDYRLLYETASWLSHPGLIGSDMHLIEGDDGSIRLADEGPSAPRQTAQGLALGMGTLARIMDRLNWIFGPVPGVAPRMSDVYEAVDATEVPPGGFYSK